MGQKFYMSIEEAKLFFCIETLKIIKNENTGNESILLPNDDQIPIQKDIDRSKPMFLTTEVTDSVGDPDWFESKLVNYDPTIPDELSINYEYLYNYYFNGYLMRVEDAKKFFGVETLRVVKNEKNGRISILLPNGTFIRVKQDFDKTQPLVFLTTAVDADGKPDWDESCLINYEYKNDSSVNDSILRI
jgi:hypothetical protein